MPDTTQYPFPLMHPTTNPELQIGFAEVLTPSHEPKTALDNILTERGSRYGKFTGHAAIAQGLKDFMRDQNNWEILSDDQREALEMIAHKIGRILNGDPNYDDSWVDIGGYAGLIVKRLQGTEV